jgi:histidine ammonia-lyase
MNAAQALEFRKPLKSSHMIEELVKAYRKEVDFVQNDIEMHPAMKNSILFVQQYANKIGVKDFL